MEGKLLMLHQIRTLDQLRYRAGQLLGMKQVGSLVTLQGVPIKLVASIQKDQQLIALKKDGLEFRRDDLPRLLTYRPSSPLKEEHMDQAQGVASSRTQSAVTVTRCADTK